METNIAISGNKLTDPFGRDISYMRLSVTDRCDFRCLYCMAEDMTFLPKKDLLSLEELERLCDVFVSLGVRKLRLTGGEPLVRKGVMGLIRNLGAHVAAGRLEELTLTTNGSQLGKYAEELADAGVKRINVSLDSLCPDRFSHITRWGRLEDVLDGINAAKAAGIHIKINTVALNGLNDDEFVRLAQWCGAEGHDLTFIETMPMGEISEDRTDRYLPLSEVKAQLEGTFTLVPSNHRTGGPSRYFDVKESGTRIGFITPMSHNFCESCNRVRVTCTGTLFMCLGQDDKADLRAALRASEGNDRVEAAIREAITRKPKGHDFVIGRGAAPAVTRHMSVTGG